MLPSPPIDPEPVKLNEVMNVTSEMIPAIAAMTKHSKAANLIPPKKMLLRAFVIVGLSGLVNIGSIFIVSLHVTLKELQTLRQ